jgi:hypothetical protein
LGGSPCSDSFEYGYGSVNHTPLTGVVTTANITAQFFHFTTAP